MRLFRFLFVPLVLLPLLLAAAWHWRYPVGEYVTDWSLRRMGFDVVKIKIGALTATRAHVEQLTFADPKAGWHMQATNLSASYRLEELIGGRIEYISIDNLTITVDEDPSQPARTMIEPLQVLALLRGKWREHIPFREARVERLRLLGDGFGVANGEALAMVLSRQNSNLNLRIELLDRPDSPRALIAKSPDSNHINVALQGTGDTAPLDIDLQLATDSVTAETSVDLAAMRQWLLPIAGNILPDTLRGIVRGDVMVKFSENTDYSLDLAFNVQPLELSDLSIDHLSARIIGHGQGPELLAALDIESGSRLRLDFLRHPALNFETGEIALAGLFQRLESGWKLTLQPQNQGTFTSLSINTLQSDKLAMTLAGEIEHQAKQTSIRLTPDFEAAFSKLDLGIAGVTALLLAPMEETSITLSGEQPLAWVFDQAKWRIETSEISADGTLLIPENIRLKLETLAGEEERWELAANIDLDGLLLKMDELEISTQGIAANITGNPSQIDLKGKLSLTGNPAELTLLLNHELLGEKGSMALSTPQKMEFSSPDNVLSKLLNNWPYEFDLVSGIFDLHLSSSWSSKRPTQLAAQVTIENGGGNFQQALFSGLLLDGEFEMLPRLKTKRSAKVKVETLDFGVMIQDIETQVDLLPSAKGTEPLLIAEPVSGSAYGTGFSSRRLIYDLNDLSGSLNLTLDGINLERLVALAEREDLTATGILNGYIPLKISSAGVKVDQGRLWSRPPGGLLSYHPENETASSESNSSMTDYAFNALRDYRYHQLAANLQYEPDGTLVMNLQLKGISPAVDEKRPVHLSINLEQNLLSLLKSLRYSQGLNDEVDKQVREHFRNKTSPH